MPLRTGVVGAGKIGRIHTHILATHEQSTLVAICSRRAESANALAETYHVRGFTNVVEMIEVTGIEALIVCTPHPIHAEVAVPALERGVHVLVEKPLAASLYDCDRMLAAARHSGAKLGVVSQRRWLPAAQRVKRAIEDGKIGHPILGVATLLGWRDEAYYQSDPWRGRWETEGGGVLINQAPHQLDLLLWYMGEVEQVFGWWGNFNHPYVEVEDTAVALVKFKSGAFGNIITSNSQRPGLYGKVHVHGTSGASVGVQTDGGSMFIAGSTTMLEPPFNDLWTIVDETALLNTWRDDDSAFFRSIDPVSYYLRKQVEEFLEAIRAGRHPAVTGEDGRRVVELFTAIYRSQKAGAPISFPIPATHSN